MDVGPKGQGAVDEFTQPVNQGQVNEHQWHGLRVNPVCGEWLITVNIFSVVFTRAARAGRARLRWDAHRRRSDRLPVR